MCHCEHSEAMTRGFTLAEVLITLAIIGVVAALTIPTLVTNYQQRGWNTAATVFERKLEESLKVMNTQGTLAGYKTTEAFVNELQKHLKIIKVCKNDDLLSCFEDKISMRENFIEADLSNISTASDFGLDWGTNLAGIQLNNGTNGIIAYNPECKQNPYSNQINGSDCIAILYDTSGFTKPNYLSKDLRANQNVKKIAGKSVCAFEIYGTCYTTPFKPTPLTKAECEDKKNDLGIQNCNYDIDFWAGAVAQCGSVSKMPTGTQLGEIADYIYNTNGIGTSYKSEITRDDEKASSLGFTSGDTFYVWSGEEISSYSAYTRNFYPTSTRWDTNHHRQNSVIQAVCLGD